MELPKLSPFPPSLVKLFAWKEWALNDVVSGMRGFGGDYELEGKVGGEELRGADCTIKTINKNSIPKTSFILVVLQPF